jgi:hypothetical protein
MKMPRPFERGAVHARLLKLRNATDLFETEDRDKVYTYMILIWRAAGFSDNSGLLDVTDERALELDPDYQASK